MTDQERINLLVRRIDRLERQIERLEQNPYSGMSGWRRIGMGLWFGLLCVGASSALVTQFGGVPNYGARSIKFREGWMQDGSYGSIDGRAAKIDLENERGETVEISPRGIRIEGRDGKLILKPTTNEAAAE